MMIYVCPECGYEHKKCGSCSGYICPRCGGQLKKVDYVKHVLGKQNDKKR